MEPTNKNPISMINDYCTKFKKKQPKYEIVEMGKNEFRCQVFLFDQEFEGIGSSKRVAKFRAATNAVGMILPDVKVQDDTDKKSKQVDIISKLRYICERKAYPNPVMEIVDQDYSDKDNFQFTASCSLFALKTYGQSNNRLDAMKKAAQDMLKAIRSKTVKKTTEQYNESGNVAESDTDSDDVIDVKVDRNDPDRFYDLNLKRRPNVKHPIDTHTKQLFSIFRALCPTVRRCNLDGKLSDRHKFFSSYPYEKKLNVLKIITEDEGSGQDQVDRILKELNIGYKITEMESAIPNKPMLFLELNLKYDAVFAGENDQIFVNVINYFRDMLL